jgi:hypothetical protein
MEHLGTWMADFDGNDGMAAFFGGWEGKEPIGEEQTFLTVFVWRRTAGGQNGWADLMENEGKCGFSLDKIWMAKFGFLDCFCWMISGKLPKLCKIMAK